MTRLRWWLVLFLGFWLVSCMPGANDATSPGDSGQESASGPRPVASTTPLPDPGAPQLVLLSPLQIDSENGRLFSVAQINGELKIAVLNARDGVLLAAWDGSGQLALDAPRDRLVVDRGAQGLALLSASTGETQAVIDLPPQDGPPAPQINAKTGMVYAFRNSTIYIIDPAIGAVIRSIPLTVPRVVCDAPSGDTPINQTTGDPTASRLYLSFISHTCIPWATATIIAYDTTQLGEIGRTEVDVNTQFLAYDKSLFGLSVNRLGPTTYWAWDGVTRWHDESGDFQGQPAGMVVDRERKLIYEAVGETIRIIDLTERTLLSQVNAPLLNDSRLAGHDPVSDNLFLISTTGRLYLWPAENLFNKATTPAAAPSPLPIATVKSLSLAPNWVDNRTMAAVIESAECPDGGQLFVMINPASGWLPSPTGDDRSCESVVAVTFSPAYKQDSLLFAATLRPPTILRSLDTGRSWTAADSVFPEGTHIIALLPSPGYASDQTIFALTTTGLLYRSRDGGRNWQLLDQRLDQVALAGVVGPAIHLYGAFGGRILRSTNGGETWKEAGATPNGEQLILLAATPSSDDFAILYAFTAGGRFARSLDGGATWNPIMETSPGPAQLAIANDVVEDQRPVFFLHDRSMTASYDGMASVWAATSADEAGRFRPTAIAISPDFNAMPYLFAGTADGQIVRVRADAQP